MLSGSDIFFAAVFALVASYALGGMSAAPWVRTRVRERRMVADIIRPRDGGVVYDIGCGDGVMLFMLAPQYPRATFIGYEVSLLPLLLGWAKKAFGGAKYRNVHIRFGDFFGHSIANADVVFVYLLEKAYARVAAKLAAELRDDAEVVVAVWPLADMPTERVVRTSSEVFPIYVYRAAAIKAASHTAGK